ncbi:MAG TPA: BlaI/MecI/CopY family transcriptional regulator, partial [Pirellulales bacterium]
MPEPSELSRRERQIMDAVFALGEATVNQVVEAIPSPPTTMAVRRMMHILEEKGHLRRRESGREVVYV